MTQGGHNHLKSSGSESLPLQGLPAQSSGVTAPAKHLLHCSRHILVPQCIYDGVDHGGDDGVEQRNELALILGGVAGLEVSVDGRAIEQGDHRDVGPACPKRIPLPCR